MSLFPLVSIIIPTKNRRVLLQETLDSLVAQSYRNWEAIVVDDGSKDGTFEGLVELANREPRIKPFRRKSRMSGAPVCRNEGLGIARGAYVIFMDSDDLLAPHCLQQRVSFLEGRCDLGYAVFQAELFDRVPGDRGEPLNRENGQDPLERILNLDAPWQTMCALWRRGSLETLGRWDEQLAAGQDMDYFSRALVLGLAYRWVPAADCFYRTAEDCRETIGNQTLNATVFESHMRRVARTRRMLRARDALGQRQRELILGNVLCWATLAAEEGFYAEAFSIWKRSRRRGFLDLRQFVAGELFFRLCRTRLGRVAFWLLMRIWPENAFVGTREAEGEGMLELTDRRHPLARHALVAREGLGRYLWRHLRPRQLAGVSGLFEEKVRRARMS